MTVTADGNIDWHGLEPGAVLAALYNAAQPRGMGMVNYNPTPMTPEQGFNIFEQYRFGAESRLDYLLGRVMKVTLNLETQVFHPGRYDRDNGEGAAAMAIDTLRQSGDPAGLAITEHHRARTITAALEARAMALEAAVKRVETVDGVSVVEIGLGDVAPRIQFSTQKILD